MLLLAASYACSCVRRLPVPSVPPRRSGQQQLCQGAPASNSFPMLPHCLPCRVSRAAATLPHRLPLRSSPPPRFACGSSHSRGHGRPRSVRKSSRLRWKCLSMDCIYPQDCCCSDRRKSFGPSAPIAYATSVSSPDEAVAWPWCRYPMGDKATAWPGRRCLVLDMAATWPGTSFLQITARANPCPRHLWGTLARAVASI